MSAESPALRVFDFTLDRVLIPMDPEGVILYNNAIKGIVKDSSKPVTKDNINPELITSAISQLQSIVDKTKINREIQQKAVYVIQTLREVSNQTQDTSSKAQSVGTDVLSKKGTDEKESKEVKSESKEAPVKGKIVTKDKDVAEAWKYLCETHYHLIKNYSEQQWLDIRKDMEALPKDMEALPQVKALTKLMQRGSELLNIYKVDSGYTFEFKDRLCKSRRVLRGDAGLDKPYNPINLVTISDSTFKEVLEKGRKFFAVSNN